MKSLKIFLIESKETNPSLITTPEEAIEYFGIKDEKEKIIINKLYQIANSLEKNGIIPYPFVENYKSSKKFAVRRWVETNTEWVEYCKENNIDSNFFKTLAKKSNKTFGEFHNTSLQKIDEFPNMSDNEILIAVSLNMKGGSNLESSLKYALGFEDNLTKNEDILYEKFKAWINDNKEYVKRLGDNIEVEKGEMFRKLHNSESSTTDEWKEKGNFDKNPNKTPKTDIISSKGRKFSIKSSGGSQSMSGGMNETKATLMTYMDYLKDEDKKQIEELFNSNWEGKDNERNKKLTEILRKIMDPEKNIQFVTSVLAESILGIAKFGESSNSVPNKMISFGKNGAFEEDVYTYIYRVAKSFDPKTMIHINQKSSGNKTYGALRISLPKHNEPFEQLSDKERKECFKLINKQIKDIKKEEHEEYGEITDEKGKKIKKIMHTGPRGGKFYISDTGEHIYPQEWKK